jgi:hypothetical protein
MSRLVISKVFLPSGYHSEFNKPSFTTFCLIIKEKINSEFSGETCAMLPNLK